MPDRSDDHGDGEPRLNRPVARVLAKLRGSTLASLYDQGVQSGLNFAAAMLLAWKYADRKEEFADFVMVVAVLQVTMAFHRSLIVLPFIMTQSRERPSSTAGGWWMLNLLFLAATSALLAIGWAVCEAVPSLAGYARVARLSLVLCPAVLAYEFSRRWMYQIERYPFSNLAATLLGLGYAGGVAVAMMRAGGIEAAIYGYAAGAVAAALTLAGLFLGELRWSADTWRDYRPLLPAQSWHLLSSVAHMTYTTAMPLLIPFFGSKETVAAYGAARTLVNPVMTARTALDSVEKPKASKALERNGIAAMQRVLHQMRNKLLLLAGPVLLVLTLFGGVLLGRVGYGDQYPVLVICVGAVLAILVAQPYESRLVLTRNSRALLVSKIASGVLSVAALAVLTQPLDAVGAALASLVAGLVSFAVMRSACRKSTATEQRESDKPREPTGPFG